jgi:hypothetical protein
MNNLFQILVRHGYTLLFLGVFGEQIGLPLPAEPLLLAAGVVAAEDSGLYSRVERKNKPMRLIVLTRANVRARMAGISAA